MTIEASLKQIAEELAKINAHLAGSATVTTSAPAPEPEPEKQEELPPQAPLEVPEPEAPAAATGAEQPTLDAIGKKITGMVAKDASLRPAIVELLAQFGAKKASGVPEDKRAEFLAGLEKIDG